MVLRAWVAFVQQYKPAHLSLHFDGIRIDAQCVNDSGLSMQDFTAQSAAHIFKETGFEVTIVEKAHLTFLQLLIGKPHCNAKVPEACKELLNQGNCIPLALWRFKHCLKGDVPLLIREDETANAAALASGARTYRRCFSTCKVSSAVHVGFAPKSSGSYLVHLESDGNPHCIAIAYDSRRREATVYHQELVFNSVALSELKELFGNCVDHLSVVTFQVASSEVDLAKPYTDEDEVHDLGSLLDLSAGAGSSADDLVAIADEIKLPITLEDVQEPEEELATDRDSCTSHVRASLFDLLQQEVFLYTKEIKTSLLTAVYRKGQTHKCSLCPFRSFRTRRYLLQHVCERHTSAVKHVASGRKQLNVVYALFDQCQVPQTEATGGV